MTVATSPTTTFQRYAHEVYAWAYRLLGRHHDALDVVQEVYLRWARQCDQEVPTYPRGWLRRVAVNQAIDLRRRGQVLPMASIDAVPDRLVSTSWQAGVPVDLEAFRQDVASAMAELSPSQQGVVVAKIYDGLTFVRIAEEMDVAVPTVKTHFLRAIRHLRDRLGDRWEDEVRP